jgi:predicted dehydrogenase
MVALMGCGRISERHARVLSEPDFGRLAGVCDVEPDRAARLGARYRVPFFDHWSAMVEKTRPDVVTVLTPSGMHAENVIELAGKVANLVVGCSLRNRKRVSR